MTQTAACEVHVYAGTGGHSAWFSDDRGGIAAPAGTPRPIVDRLHREIVQACAKPRLREAFLQQAAIAVTSSPEEMTRHLEREIAVWRDVIARAKVTVQ